MPPQSSTEHRDGPKRQSLVAFIVLISCLPIGIAIAYVPHFTGWEVLAGLPLLVVVAGFYIAIRIRCPRCGERLSSRLPYKGGGGILLWAVTEQCPNCGQP